MITLYTPKDVADALGVSPVTVSNWQKRYTDMPKPSFVRTNGAPLWESLDPWIEWNDERMAIAEREAQHKAEARLAKAKAELEAAMAAMGEV